MLGMYVAYAHNGTGDMFFKPTVRILFYNAV